MSLRRRALEINQIIRESEIFPRIRDAEKAMIEDEKKFIKRREKKKKKREKLLKEQQFGLNHQPKEDPNKLPPVANPFKKDAPKSPVKDYFSGFVLNRDPNCSKYMPFNEVFFPNLYNPPPDCNNPHSIDMIWMLGFQHDALKKSVDVKVKKEFVS